MRYLKLVLFAMMMVTTACNETTKAPGQSNASTGTCPLSFPKNGLCAEIIWKNTPAAYLDNSFQLRFWNAAASTSSGPYIAPHHEVSVNLWMDSMGHGSTKTPVVTSAVDAGGVIPGVYEVSNVYFTMRGDWQVQIQLKNGSEVVEVVIDDQYF